MSTIETNPNFMVFNEDSVDLRRVVADQENYFYSPEYLLPVCVEPLMVDSTAWKEYQVRDGMGNGSLYYYDAMKDACGYCTRSTKTRGMWTWSTVVNITHKWEYNKVEYASREEAIRACLSESCIFSSKQ